MWGLAVVMVWVMGCWKEDMEGWKRWSAVVRVRCVDTGEMPKLLNYAGLGAGVALHGAGI